MHLSALLGSLLSVLLSALLSAAAVRMLVENKEARAVFWRSCPRGVDLERTVAMVQRWAQEQVKQVSRLLIGPQALFHVLCSSDI